MTDHNGSSYVISRWWSWWCSKASRGLITSCVFCRLHVYTAPESCLLMGFFETKMQACEGGIHRSQILSELYSNQGDLENALPDGGFKPGSLISVKSNRSVIQKRNRQGQRSKTNKRRKYWLCPVARFCSYILEASWENWYFSQFWSSYSTQLSCLSKIMY